MRKSHVPDMASLGTSAARMDPQSELVFTKVPEPGEYEDGSGSTFTPRFGTNPSPASLNKYTHAPLTSTVTTGEEMLADVKNQLVEQRRRQLERDGESLTIMCIGEAGSGKTTLARSLFVQPIPRRSVGTKSTCSIEESEIQISMGEDAAKVDIRLRIIDSPGYGDNIDVESSFRKVTDFLESGFDRIIEMEEAAERPDYYELDARVGVDAVLYFIAPHRLKRLDIEFLRRIHKRASIIPIISKADTLTREELAYFRCDVVDTLAEEGIEIFAPPFAVVCAPVSAVPVGDGSQETVNFALGREYPWGTALADNPDHSDLPHLRRTLLTEGLLDLHEARRRKFEQYRKLSSEEKVAKQQGFGALVGNVGRFIAVVALHTFVGIGAIKALQNVFDEDDDDDEIGRSSLTDDSSSEKRRSKSFRR